MSAERTYRLQHDIYLPTAITSGAAEFAQFCQVVCIQDGDATLITIKPHEDAPEETEDELLNYILSAALDAHFTG